MILFDSEYEKGLPASFLLKNILRKDIVRHTFNHLKLMNGQNLQNLQIEYELLLKLVKDWTVDQFTSLPFQPQLLKARFSLVELVGKGTLPWFRLYIKWNITERDNIYILLAPLSFKKMCD